MSQSLKDVARKLYIQHEIENRYPSRVHYEPPHKFDKLFALYAIGTMRMSGSAHSVATALIWHANKRSGRCDPGQVLLAHETKLSPRTVRKAVRELFRLCVLLKRTRRGSASNAYQLNWKGLRRKFQMFEERVANFRKANDGGEPNDSDEREEEAIGTNVPVGKEQACHSMRHDQSSKPFKEPFENNTGRETVPSGPEGHPDTLPPHLEDPSEVAKGAQRPEQGESADGSSVRETDQGSQEERNRPHGAGRDVNEWWWRRRHRELVAELERCDDPKRRKELQQRIARAEGHVRGKAAA